jgi:hypothetical protein
MSLLLSKPTEAISVEEIRSAPRSRGHTKSLSLSKEDDKASLYIRRDCRKAFSIMSFVFLSSLSIFVSIRFIIPLRPA